MNRKIVQEFVDANIIEVTVEHNGIKGGDAGHGGFVKIVFKDIASTYMKLNGVEVNEFELFFGGDAERETLVDALKMIVKELEENT